ncbi:MAG: septal ring lytic transglycosylase RlpA family protein [Acetobacteraceae bacterium]|nr:septal ring lytic transglycosylase RlpA family protein [Acetobacteraceae bacterium]
MTFAALSLALAAPALAAPQRSAHARAAHARQVAPPADDDDATADADADADAATAAADADAATARTFQTGVASWYGGRWSGNRTASGETFDDDAMTGAHATLPLGAHVRVTVLDTGRSVVIRINDRIGTRRRVIDLSRAAAAALRMENRGLATVSLARID